MARPIGSIVPTIFISHLVAVAVAGMMGTPARAADECLAAPNAPSAEGNHWYYRIDRATRRKCWYQRAQATGKPRVARPTLPPQVAEPASASEPPMKPLAFAQSTAWPEIIPPRERREAGVQRRETVPTTQSMDRQDIGLSVATRTTNGAAIPMSVTPTSVAPASNDAQPQTPIQLASVATIAPAAIPAPDPESFSPIRVLFLVIGILVVPGILLRLVFKFFAATRLRIFAEREDRKKWSESVSRNCAPATFDETDLPLPLVPMEPVRQPVDAEQLLRTILRELERSAGRAMPDPVSADSRG
jgi:hypothetical protein